MAGTGQIVFLIEVLLKFFGFEFPDGSVAGAINGGVLFVSFILMIWGQLRRKDLIMGWIRK